MKLTIDVDCTPEEARRFLGLPDVAPLQERMLAEMEKRMMEAMAGLDAENLMKQWITSGMTPGLEGTAMEGMGKMMQAFWSQMGGFPSGDSKKNS